MSTFYPFSYLRDEVARIIEPSLYGRRASQLSHGEPNVPELDSPPVEWEIDEFIAQCPFDNYRLANMLVSLEAFADIGITLSDEEFEQFLKDIAGWTQVNAWVAGDEWPVILDTGEVLSSREFALVRQFRYSQRELLSPWTRIEIVRFSPSFGILYRLLERGIQLEALSWREFEELIAELLTKEGYDVQLGPGRKDGGKDIIATMELGETGLFKVVWQAKKLKPGNKVGLGVIRELVDTRMEEKASKAIIATNTFLTGGALTRVRRDQYLLVKVDRNDLLAWMEKVARKGRS